MEGQDALYPYRAPYPCVVPTSPPPLSLKGDIGVAALLFGGFALASWISGVSLAQSVVIALAILWQAVGGLLLWRMARPHYAGPLESVGMGIALGSVIAVIFAAIAQTFIQFRWWWAVPTIVILVVAVIRQRRSKGVESPPGESGNTSVWVWQVWVLIVGAIAVGLAALTINFRRYPLDGSNSSLFHPDMLFFEALSTSTAQYGGAESAFLAGESIRYHWMAYAWAGQLTNSLDLSVFVMLTRALPILVLITSVVLVIAWVRVLTTQWWVPWLATALLITGGYLGAVNGTVLNFDSPSQALTALWLIALVFLVTQWLRDQYSSRVLPVVLIFALSVGLATGKGSAGAVAVGAFAIGGVLALILFRHDPAGKIMTRRLWVAFAVATLAFVLSYFLLLSGNASSGGLQFLTFDGHASTAQGLDSSPTYRGVVLGTMGLLLAMSARFIGVFGWFTNTTDRRSPEALVSVGLIVSGLVPVIVFSESINETWFALAVSAPLSVLSAVGVGIAVQQARFSPRVHARIANPWISNPWISNPWIWILLILVSIATFIAVSFVWTDQVWESGFGRFYAPWLGYLMAFVVAFIVAFAAGTRGHRVIAGLAAFVIVLSIGASLARFTPAVAAAMGGARDGVGVGVADFADLPIRNQPTPDQPTPDQSTPDQPATQSIQPEGVADSIVDEAPVMDAVPLTDLFYGDRFEMNWGVAELDFAQQLRDLVSPDSVIATNELFYPLIPAISGRLTYLSAARYQELYGTAAGNEKIPTAREHILNFMSDPNSSSAQPLCEEAVEWIWLTSPDPAKYLEISGLSATVVVGENALIPLTPTLCGT